MVTIIVGSVTAFAPTFADATQHLAASITQSWTQLEWQNIGAVREVALLFNRGLVFGHARILHIPNLSNRFEPDLVLALSPKPGEIRFFNLSTLQYQLYAPQQPIDRIFRQELEAATGSVIRKNEVYFSSEQTFTAEQIAAQAEKAQKAWDDLDTGEKTRWLRQIATGVGWSTGAIYWIQRFYDVYPLGKHFSSFVAPFFLYALFRSILGPEFKQISASEERTFATIGLMASLLYVYNQEFILPNGDNIDVTIGFSTASILTGAFFALRSTEVRASLDRILANVRRRVSDLSCHRILLRRQAQHIKN